MANFIEVPAQVLEDWLVSKKFVRDVQNNEIVYKKQSTVNPVVFIKVYTSIRVGATSVRGAGKDAIRIVVIGDNGHGRTWGIGKFPPVPRVHSVESVLRRTEERLKAAAARATEWIALNKANQPAWKTEQEQDRAIAAVQPVATPVPIVFDEPPPGFIE